MTHFRGEGFSLEYRSAGRPSVIDNQGNGIRAAQILLQCYNKCPNSLAPALQFLKEFYDEPYFVPFELRHGAAIYGIALFLQDETCKNAKLLAQNIKSRQLDMVQAWIEVKRHVNNLNNRRDGNLSQMFAKRLSDWGSNGGHIKIAA